MDDALGHAGGAAGIEDVQRLIERHLGECRLAAGLVEILPERHPGAGPEVFDAGRGLGVGHHDQLLERR
ncbi:hypothetical protein D3C71_2115310 [compost metagenome]